MRRVLVLMAVVTVAVIVAAVAGGAWYIADEIRNGALAVTHAPPVPDTTVVAVGDHSVTLRPIDPNAFKDGDWGRVGTWGLKWNGGYARVGKIIALGDHQAER